MSDRTRSRTDTRTRRRTDTNVVPVLYPDFESLQLGAGGEQMTYSALASLARESGRVLLQAEAGAGKTTLLEKLNTTVGSGGRFELVDLRRHETSSSGPWSDPSEAVGWLNDLIGVQGEQAIVCIDGLDETNPSVANFILAAVDELSFRNPSTSFIVSDRIARRNVRSRRWRFVGVARSGDRAATEDGGDPIPYYYIDRALEADARNRAKVHEEYLKLETDVLDGISRAALAAWEASESSLFGQTWLAEFVSDDEIQILLSRGILQSVGADVVCFDHRLTHAYLAARALSTSRARWNANSFKAITQSRANYDSLSLLLELVDAAFVDELVQRVDAWSYRASAHLLAHDNETSKRVSGDLASALVMLLGLRKLDRIPMTRIQAEDSLRAIGGDLADDVLAADSVENLQELVSNLEGTSDWWTSWKAIYMRQVDDDAGYEDVEALTTDNSIVGWTASNVLHHLRFNDDMFNGIRELAIAYPDDTVRWRAIHALEGHKNRATFEVCLDRLDSADETVWVKYGALRTAVIVAAGLESKEARQWAMDRLSERASTIGADARFHVELTDALQLDHPPPGWASAVSPLIARLWSESKTESQQEQWMNVESAIASD